MASGAQATVILVYLLLCLLVTPTKNESPTPEGHLQKLGSHRKPKGVTMVGKFSRPETFYFNFVEPGVPLLMRGALDVAKHPGLSNWTDSYLRNRFGDEMVNVETSRKENRRGRRTSLSMRQFLNLYLTEDIYLVHTLTGKMSELVLVPESVQCGGFQKVLQEAVLWMGCGESASVLHYDELDNLLCLLDGHKDVALIDKNLKALVEAQGFNQGGGYSDIDVDKVDLEKYSHLQNIEWYTASVLKGDCLFIPKGWYHHVRSSGLRHMAVNLWLSHLWWLNTSDCLPIPSSRPLKPIQDFGFASPNEVQRAKLLEVLHGHDFADRDKMISAITTATKERANQFLNAIDEEKDMLISVRELYNFNIDLAVYKFPDVFGLPHNPVPGEEKEDIILYPVKSDTETDSEQGKQTNSESKEETSEAEEDFGETKNVQGFRVRSTKPDDIGDRGEIRTYQSEVEEGGLSEDDFMGDTDGPDSPLEEEDQGSDDVAEPQPLLPDDQVVGVEATRDDSADETSAKIEASDSNPEKVKSTKTDVKEEL